MADRKQVIDDWLDAPSGAPPPQFQSTEEIDNFLDAPEAPQPTGQDIDSWLDTPEDTWAQLGAKIVRSVAPGFMQSAAGLSEQIAERPISMMAPVTPGTPLAAGAQLADVYLNRASDWLREKMGMEPNQSAQVSAQIYADAEADLQENAPNVDPDSLKSYVYDTATSFIQMLPAVAASIATRKPVVGATIIGGQVGGQRYGESRAEGRTPEQAGQDALFYTVAEAVPEMFPLGILMKPGGKFFGRVLKTAGAEWLQEMFTQTLQTGYDAGVLQEDMTFGEAMDAIKRAGIIGAVTGGALGAAAHPFVRDRGAENTPTNVAAGAPLGAATGTPPGSAPPAADPAAATTPQRMGPWSTPPMVKGATVGLKNKKGPPVRAEIEAIQDGYVFWRDEQGNPHEDREAEFRKDLTAPPPPRRGAEGVATPPGDATSPPVPTDSDINDFDPYAIKESKPQKTPDQRAGSLSLPETGQIRRLRDAANAHLQLAGEAQRILDSGSPQARTPEAIAAMKVEAAKLMDQAAELEGQLTPRRASQDPTAATPEQMAGRRMGLLGARPPAISEATTGPQEFEVKAPTQVGKIPTQGALAPVERSEAEFPQEPQLRPKAPEVPWQQRLRQRIAARSARVNDAELIAKQLGVTPQEVSKELLNIAGSGPKAPIQMVRGSISVDPKTGEVQRSKYAGRFRYTPKPTGEAVQSLSDLVYDSGGIRPGTFAGEFEARDLHTRQRPFKGKLVRPAARMDTQQMADHALQLGYRIKPDATGNHADIDDFMTKLEQDEFKVRRHYAIGEEPIPEAERPATPQQRKAAAIARLKELEFEPTGTTHEELEAQLDDYENAIGDIPPIDRLDLHRAMEQDSVDRLDDDAKAALQREVPNDSPYEYDEEWFRQESGGSAPAAFDPADERDAARNRPSGTQPEGEGAAAGRLESADETARDADQQEIYTGPKVGDLWRYSAEEVDQLAADVRNSDDRILTQVFGEDGAKRFRALDRASNSSDDKRADQAYAKLGEMEDALSPEKRAIFERWQREGWGPDPESIEIVRRSHEVYDADDSIQTIAADAAYGLTRAGANDILDVPNGNATATDQAAYVRFMNAVRELRERGVDGDTIPRLLTEAMMRRGIEPNDAADIVGRFLETARGRSKGQKPKAAAVARDAESANQTEGLSSATDEFKDQNTIIDKTLDAMNYVNRDGGTAAGWVSEIGKRTGHEHLAITENGRVIGATTSNSAGRVNYVTEGGQYVPTRALALYHNHPITAALSNPDIRSLGFPGTGFMVAISHDGNVSAAILTPEVHRYIAGQSWRSATDFLDDLYRSTSEILSVVEPDGVKRQDLTLRALASAGVIDYVTTFPIAASKLQPVQVAARTIREAFNAANVETGGASNRPAFYQRPAEALAAISDRTAERQSERSADPALRRMVQERIDRQTSRNEAARNAAEPGADRRPADGSDNRRTAQTAIGRILQDEAGALTLPDWNRIKAFFQRDRRSPQTPRDIARQALRINLGSPDTLQGFGKLGQWFRYAVSLAAVDRPSSIHWNAQLRRDHLKTRLERRAIDQVRDYLALDTKARDRVNKILEYDRLYGIDRKDTGRTVVVRIPERRPPFGEGRPELTKPGEIVALDREETAALHKMRDFFDERLMMLGEAVARERGYDGPFNEDAIQEAIDDAGSPRERKLAQAAMEIFKQTTEMRRTGYVPFQRYGDTFILIKPKAPETATPETAWFELVDTKSMFDKVFSRPGGKPRKPLEERKAELEKRFPRNKYDWKIEQATPKAVAELNIPALERVFATLNLKADKDTAGLVDSLMHQVFEARKAGFRKQSQNVPGYSTDFERAITDYVRQSSAVIARMSTRKDVDSAFDAVMKHPVKEVRDYWEAHQHHQEKEGGDYAGLRKFGFFMFLWGTFGAPVVNLTQTPLVTQFQLGSWAGPRATWLAHNALQQALRAIRPTRDGLTISIDNIQGVSDAERAMLHELDEEGRFVPSVTNEMMGFDKGRSRVRPHLNAISRIFEIGTSAFNVTERANRIAAALAYFRAAQNPQLREKMQQVYARDENFKEMVGRHPQPTDIARFGVDETQFIGGKLNRMPAMRGVGALILQFKTYVANYIRLLHKNFTRMGPRGKIAGAMQLALLYFISGLMGLPGADDLLGMIDGLLGQMGLIDQNLEYQFRNWIADSGFGEYGAEIMTRGIGRDVWGLDIGGRLGMGNIFPDNSFTSLMPVITGTAGAAMDAMERYHSGQPAGAAAAVAPMVAGKGGADLIKALIVYPEEGISTKRGNWIIRPEDVTTADMARRALGFQSTKATREGEILYQRGRIMNATRAARAAQLTALARNVVLMQQAATKGDREKSAQYQKKIDKLYADNIAQLLDPDIPDWQKIKPASRLAVKRRVQSLLQPEIAALKRAGKLSREELLDMPFVEEE